MGLYKREHYFMIVAAVLFLIGAVFMLVNTFGNQEWALWVGLAFAIAAVLVYILIQIQHLQFKKKYTVKKSELKDVAERETSTATINKVAEKVAPAAIADKKPVAAASKKTDNTKSK